MLYYWDQRNGHIINFVLSRVNCNHTCQLERERVNKKEFFRVNLLWNLTREGCVCCNRYVILFTLSWKQRLTTTFPLFFSHHQTIFFMGRKCILMVQGRKNDLASMQNYVYRIMIELVGDTWNFSKSLHVLPSDSGLLVELIILLPILIFPVLQGTVPQYSSNCCCYCGTDRFNEHFTP